MRGLVGPRPVHHETVEKERAPSLQRHVDLLHLLPFVFVLQFLVLCLRNQSPVPQSPLVTPRYDIETAVLSRGVIQGDADRYERGGIDGPVGRVLVRRVGGTVESGFEHQGTSEQQQIRSE